MRLALEREREAKSHAERRAGSLEAENLHLKHQLQTVQQRYRPDGAGAEKALGASVADARIREELLAEIEYKTQVSGLASPREMGC